MLGGGGGGGVKSLGGKLPPQYIEPCIIFLTLSNHTFTCMHLAHTLWFQNHRSFHVLSLYIFPTCSFASDVAKSRKGVCSKNLDFHISGEISDQL